MKNRNTLIVVLVSLVLVLVLWDRLADLGAEISKALA